MKKIASNKKRTCDKVYKRILKSQNLNLDNKIQETIIPLDNSMKVQKYRMLNKMGT